MNFKKLWMRLKWFAVFAMALGVAFVEFVAVPVHASSTSDMTSAITEWLPVIIQFVMLAMVMGILKKFGKW